MFLIKGEFKLITLQEEFNKAVCSSVEDIKKKAFHAHMEHSNPEYAFYK